LETEYGLLGSARVLDLLARDLQSLVNQFYPPPERVPSGWMVFTGTKASGPKPHPGQTASAHELVTLAWPVLLSEDLQRLSALPAGAAGMKARQEWFQQRLIRIVEHGEHAPEGPVLLTLADLGAMLGLSTVQVSQLLSAARQVTGKPLLTKGHYFDQGMRPTHKDEIIALYEAGTDEAEIARRSNHAPDSVGHYIRDYEKVKLLLTRRIPAEQIDHLVDLQPNVVRAYTGMVHKYHPELGGGSEPSP
jgi:hypothetical protein